MEQTYIMIKPDGVQRGLVGQIIQRFESKGFFLRGMKMMSVEKAHAEKHYADLSSKPFFGDLVDYMCSGPVVCMVWEGKEVVKTGRKIIGATNPLYVPRNHTPLASRSVPRFISIALRRQFAFSPRQDADRRVSLH
jgi:nucleoside diphosphate kinase